MDGQGIATILAGVTVLYAGILSLTDNVYVGAGMVVVGGTVAAMGVWRGLHKPPAGDGRSAAKGKRKTRLTIVKDQDERPTYH